MIAAPAIVMAKESRAMVHDLPEDVLAPLTGMLLDTLHAGAGDHDRAEFLVRFANPARRGPSSYSYGALRAADPYHEIHFTEPDAASEIIQDALARSQALDAPVRTLHFTFARTTWYWTYQVAVETLADYVAFRPALKTLQGQVAGDLVPLLGQAWTTVSLTRQALPPRPDKLVVRSTGQRQLTEPPAPLRRRLDEVQALLLANRRILRTAAIRIAGRPDDVMAAATTTTGCNPADHARLKDATTGRPR